MSDARRRLQRGSDQRARSRHSGTHRRHERASLQHQELHRALRAFQAHWESFPGILGCLGVLPWRSRSYEPFRATPGCLGVLPGCPGVPGDLPGVLGILSALQRRRGTRSPPFPRSGQRRCGGTLLGSDDGVRPAALSTRYRAVTRRSRRSCRRRRSIARNGVVAGSRPHSASTPRAHSTASSTPLFPGCSRISCCSARRTGPLGSEIMPPPSLGAVTLAPSSPHGGSPLRALRLVTTTYLHSHAYSVVKQGTCDFLCCYPRAGDRVSASAGRAARLIAAPGSLHLSRDPAPIGKPSRRDAVDARLNSSNARRPSFTDGCHRR